MQSVALVTGANRGIGFEACRQLARDGFLVILTSRRRQEGLQAVEELAAEGRTVQYANLDVTRPHHIFRLQEFVIRELGRLDVLVNNAGIYLDEGSGVLEVPQGIFERTMNVNFYGPLHLTRAFLPLMKRQNYGRIINVSSSAGSLTVMGVGDYSAPAYMVSKAALNALTRLTAAEVKGYNIKVNSMCPGWVRTDMGGPEAPRSPAKGAESIIWLATLPASGPSGGFFRDKKRIPW
jgi:NAD(P)-dependent dehydrogenase (short-subunit alcohol dehydrogenase family)